MDFVLRNVGCWDDTRLISTDESLSISVEQFHIDSASVSKTVTKDLCDGITFNREIWGINGKHESIIESVGGIGGSVVNTVESDLDSGDFGSADGRDLAHNQSRALETSFSDNMQVSAAERASDFGAARVGADEIGTDNVKSGAFLLDLAKLGVNACNLGSKVEIDLAVCNCVPVLSVG